MQKHKKTQKRNFKRNQLRPQRTKSFTRKLFKKLRPLPAGLDRLQRASRSPLSRFVLKTKSNNASSYRTRYFVGPVGPTALRRAAVTRRTPLRSSLARCALSSQLSKMYVTRRRGPLALLVGQKYRIKFIALDRYPTRTAGPRLAIRNLLKQLSRRQRKTSARGAHLLYAQARNTGQLLTLRKLFSLQSFRKKHRLLGRLPHRKYRKLNKIKILARFTRNRRLRTRKFHLKATTSIPADGTGLVPVSRLQLLRSRRNRIGGRGLVVRLFRRP